MRPATKPFLDLLLPNKNEPANPKTKDTNGTPIIFPSVVKVEKSVNEPMMYIAVKPMNM